MNDITNPAMKVENDVLSIIFSTNTVVQLSGGHYIKKININYDYNFSEP